MEVVEFVRLSYIGLGSTNVCLCLRRLLCYALNATRELYDSYLANFFATELNGITMTRWIRDGNTRFQEKLFATAKLLSQLNGSIQQQPEPRRTSETDSTVHINPPSHKSLDRLAKVFACYAGNAGNHGCATTFVRMTDDTPRIYISKNNGLTPEDSHFLPVLERFIRNFAQCEHGVYDDRTVLNWILVHNRSEIEKCFGKVADLGLVVLKSLCSNDEARALADAIHDLCLRHPNVRAKDNVAHDILTHASRLRKMIHADNLDSAQGDMRTMIRLLGTYIPAYRTFHSEARRDSTFRNLEIIAVNHTHELRYRTRRIRRLMRKFNKQLHKPVLNPICRRRKSMITVCHAEIQLLYHLEEIVQCDTRRLTCTLAAARKHVSYASIS